VLLAGGSAFGLDAAGGVMRYLEEQKIGFNSGFARVPIVPAAVLFDLALGNKNVRPGADMGYQACMAASRKPCADGNVGAGTGASVGKMFGMSLAMKTGVGSASIRAGGLVVGAIVAVNAFGDIIDPENGKIVAGLRSGKFGPLRVGGRGYFADTCEMLKTSLGRTVLGLASRTNTVIGVVATNARLTKSEATKVAQMAHDGLARTVRPAHTMFDGDTFFALSTGNKKGDVSSIGSFAAEAMTQAILRAVKMASPAGGLPGANNQEFL
jgi:L-aminopeptidase/D-esterase-like protein